MVRLPNIYWADIQVVSNTLLWVNGLFAANLSTDDVLSKPKHIIDNKINNRIIHLQKFLDYNQASMY